MRECTVNQGHANRTRATVCAVAAAVLIALGQAGAGPAAAADFEVGAVQGHVDTTVSVGVSARVTDRDCDLIHRTNGGCAESEEYLNSDDGNLNYDKWDVFSNMYKATVDVELSWKNLGGFFRGSVFYDLVTMETDTDRTPLDRDARYRSSLINSGVVGMGYQLLDAYLYGNFKVAGRPLDIRVGNQVLSWGESLFFGTSVNAINTIDLARFRAPGSELREALLPAPMVRVSTEIVRNLSIEGFYQFYWNATQLDPAGSYFTDATFTQDLVGRAGGPSYALFDSGFNINSPEAYELFSYLLTPEPFVLEADINALGADMGIPEEAMAQRFNIDPRVFNLPPRGVTDQQARSLYKQLLNRYWERFPDDPAEMEEFLLDAVVSPAAPIVVPLVPPVFPGDPIAEAFIDPILQFLIDEGYQPRVETRVPAYFPIAYPRLRDVKPKSQGQWGVALRYFAESIRTEFGAYYVRIHDKSPSVGWEVTPHLLEIQPTWEDLTVPELGVYLEFAIETLGGITLPTAYQWTAIPTGYFREYPEDINIYALSASTELFGVAWGLEVSYRTGQPVPIDGQGVLEELIEEATGAAEEGRLQPGQRMRASGFKREKRIQAQLNAIATIGPGDPYVGAIIRGIRASSVAVAFEVAAVEFPSLDSEVVYQGPPGGGEVDELSWGYATRIQAFYDNPLGIPITVVPRVQFSHDVDGNTPGRYPFIEDRKAITLGVNVDYLGVWQFDLAYNNPFGAGPANGIKDRDWVALSVTRSF
jgi:hypothetical protein